MAKKQNYSITENNIIKELNKALRPLTTSQVSDATGYSWNTTAKYLKKLQKKGKLKKGYKGEAIYWWLKEG